MTAPDENTPADETPDGAGETGALAAASEDHDGGDPLAPLNALTEDSD
jgi:hypothetical protein